MLVEAKEKLCDVLGFFTSPTTAFDPTSVPKTGAGFSREHATEVIRVAFPSKQMDAMKLL